jgi:hypothetical protein
MFEVFASGNPMALKLSFLGGAVTFTGSWRWLAKQAAWQDSSVEIFP